MSRFIISCFGDEISSDLAEQVAVMKANDVHALEFRSMDGVNILDLPPAQLERAASILKGEGIAVSAIGSPIGKIKITDPFLPHMDRFKHTLELAHFFNAPYIRMFSFFIPVGSDPAKYRDEVMIEKGDKIPCRVGVGVRIVANISTKKANIDLSGLFPIAFAAKSGFLNGQIEVLKIGIDSAGLNMILPPPSEINDTSLQSALQAVAAIRAKLYDQNTKLIPHVLAIQYRQQVTK